MNDFSLFGNEDTRAITSNIALTGEVIYESVAGQSDKKALKRLIHRAIEQRVGELSKAHDDATPRLIWASYLVIFSPGQEPEETRCQVDIETDGERAGFAIGYGPRPPQAF
ncbi:MAG: hypothetical protein EOP11_19305, partial [Proteobacteria bacterium]